jgi:hypothetical protein
MGVDRTALRALFYAKACGADYSKTMTLGRQSIHIPPEDARPFFRKFKMAASAGEISNIFKSKYAESLFEYLGAKTIDSIDARSYQGVSIVHDMNNPIPETLKSRYSMVIDFGTLEHIFNFPVAASNVIDMTAPGGYILSMVPANNFCGHGLYQFSPELFFRTFSRENGCEIVSLFLAAAIPGQPWHEVTDPLVIHGRVKFQNYVPTNLVMLAVRGNQERQPHFIPEQSDYEFGKWDALPQVASTKAPAQTSPISRLRRLLPLRVQSALYSIRELTVRGGYRKGYRTVTPEALAAELLQRRRDA